MIENKDSLVLPPATGSDPSRVRRNRSRHRQPGTIHSMPPFSAAEAFDAGLRLEHLRIHTLEGAVDAQAAVLGAALEDFYRSLATGGGVDVRRAAGIVQYRVAPMSPLLFQAPERGRTAGSVPMRFLIPAFTVGSLLPLHPLETTECELDALAPDEPGWRAFDLLAVDRSGGPAKAAGQAIAEFFGRGARFYTDASRRFQAVHALPFSVRKHATVASVGWVDHSLADGVGPRLSVTYTASLKPRPMASVAAEVDWIEPDPGEEPDAALSPGYFV